MLADRRDIDLLIAGAARGAHVSTRDPQRARLFANAEKARAWAAAELRDTELEKSIPQNARVMPAFRVSNKKPAAAARPDGLREKRDEHYQIPELPPQA